MSSSTTFGHQHVDSRHLTFFSTLVAKGPDKKPGISFNRFEDTLTITLDILTHSQQAILLQLKEKLITLFLAALPSLEIIDDKKFILDLYLIAYADILSDIKDFYDEGLGSDATNHRPASSFNIKVAKVDYYFNADIRFVTAAYAKFENCLASMIIGCLAALVASPCIIFTFLLQLLPLHTLFDNNGGSLVKTEIDEGEDQLKLLSLLQEDETLQKDEELLTHITQYQV